VVDSGASANGGVTVGEDDLANNSGTNFGETAGVAGMAQPAMFGHVVSGISGNRATAAYVAQGVLNDLTSPMFNRGFACLYAAQVAFADYSTAPTSVDLRGTHSGYGVDTRNGSFTGGALRLSNTGFIVARKADDTGDYQMLASNGSNNVTVGATGSAINPYVKIASTTGLAPENDNAQVCGQNGARWSAVWAVNGTIQTSDPTLKTDIAPVAEKNIGAIIEGIRPITFRWIDGGGGKPGKRQHWGWNAEEVGAVFDKLGEDFGGFVVGDDGTRHLRPDQLLPILWAEVRNLRLRLANLEAKG